jgi:hypothetical protein
MNRLQAATKRFGRPCLVLLVVASVLAGAGLVDRSFGDEGKKKESYVRTVDSSPPLSETEKEPGWRYNTDYLFAISRAVRDSTVPPAGKVFLFIPAVPLDIVLSPFAAIAGLFGD